VPAPTELADPAPADPPPTAPAFAAPPGPLLAGVPDVALELPLVADGLLGEVPEEVCANAAVENITAPAIRMAFLMVVPDFCLPSGPNTRLSRSFRRGSRPPRAASALLELPRHIAEAPEDDRLVLVTAIGVARPAECDRSDFLLKEHRI
jgi:hypothetical protein